MSDERDNAFEEAARLAEKWRDENKAKAAEDRKHGNTSMADRLDGAAIECNAIAEAIRALKGTERQVWPRWKEPSIEERPY